MAGDEEHAGPITAMQKERTFEAGPMEPMPHTLRAVTADNT